MKAIHEITATRVPISWSNRSAKVVLRTYSAKNRMLEIGLLTPTQAEELADQLRWAARDARSNLERSFRAGIPVEEVQS